MRDAPKITRRKMLAAATVTAGAAAARAAHARNDATDAGRSAWREDDVRRVALPDTDHVRTYYALARR